MSLKKWQQQPTVKRDRNAGFFKVEGWSDEWQFRSGEIAATDMWNSQSLSSLYERTEHAPELVFEPQTSSFPRMTARCWLYKSEFYWEDEDLPESQIKVLILEMTGHGQRQPLPDDIKIFVWQRDGGRCVKCGSQAVS